MEEFKGPASPGGVHHSSISGGLACKDLRVSCTSRRKSFRIPEMRRLSFRFVPAICTMLGAFSIAAAGLQAQDSPQVQTQTPPVRDSTAEADPVPAMFAHPETDRWWISGQTNWISQWHPEFRSPYQGPRSLCPQAQDATSRVLTLFTGVRLTNTNELICDV